jgi:mono/diheme cytochrome c family protein
MNQAVTRHVLALAFGALAALPAVAQDKKEDSMVARGRYLTQISGCNDCHTAGYAQAGGKVPEAQWLTGDILGWRGPWGTTYPVNLRLYMQGLGEDQWVKKAKSLSTRPPMPWFALHDMSSSDLRAMHRYIRHLGPAGEPAPAYLPPDKMPGQPFVQFPEPPK